MNLWSIIAISIIGVDLRPVVFSKKHRLLLARQKADIFREELASNRQEDNIQEALVSKYSSSGYLDIISGITAVSSVNRTALCLKKAISFHCTHQRSVNRSSSLSNRQRLLIAREKADIFAKFLKLSRESSSVNRTISSNKERLLVARQKADRF